MVATLHLLYVLHSAGTGGLNATECKLVVPLFAQHVALLCKSRAKRQNCAICNSKKVFCVKAALGPFPLNTLLFLCPDWKSKGTYIQASTLELKYLNISSGNRFKT